MSQRFRHLVLVALFAACAPLPLPAASADAEVAIPFETFTLDNGLRVVVHTDRKAPIVAVNLWYHVGSKDEAPGRTGFAHLFEHLMFQGSEHHREEYFKPFELVGATDMNGTTNQDRTNYFQNVPTTALDLALWMESDRMGHFLGALDQALLDEQRDVVKNEKRQGETQPYGQAWERLLQAMYPPGHPYRHSPIGSMADLDAAHLDDVRAWFRRAYGPNNAVLVLAGDIDLATARERVARYFGDIPAAPPFVQAQAELPRRDAATREVIHDRVAQTRLYRTWTVPGHGSAELTHLQLLVQVLAGSAASRLDRRLVHDEALVDLVAGSAQGQQLAGSVVLVANIKQGVDPARVEAVIDEELARLLRRGPDADELARAKTVIEAGFVRSIERIGGFGGKADVLAECAVFAGDPGCYRAELARLAAARPADLRRAGRRWLRQGSHTLLVMPGERAPEVPDQRSGDEVTVSTDAESDAESDATTPAATALTPATTSGVDRSAGPPMPTRFPDLRFPAPQRDRLDNGIGIVLARREGLPLVQLTMSFEGGFSADAGAALGRAGFAMAMLDEGAGERDALAFAAAAEALGAQVGSSAALDTASVTLHALSDRLAPSLALFADTVRRPRFDADEIERVRAQWLAQIAQEKTRPNSLALRLLPPLMYGEGHAYGIPFTGSGSEASIAALTRDDLLAYQRDWLRPDNATVIAVGDLDMATLKTLLTERFGDWRAPSTPRPALDRHAVELPAGERVFLIDRPGAIQSNLLIGQVVPPTADPQALAFELGNDVLGGNFMSRLNMSLREDKGWSYGAGANPSEAVGQRPWIAYAPVQADKTADAIALVRSELRDFLGERPATAEELAQARAGRVRSLPGAYETGTAVAGALVAIVRYGRPDDYVQTLRARIDGIDDEAVRAAMTVLAPDRLTWVVVGDLATIEAPVRALQIGPVQVLDADGRPVARDTDPAPANPED